MNDKYTASAAERAEFDAMLASDLREERRLMRGEVLVLLAIALLLAARYAVFGAA